MNDSSLYGRQLSKEMMRALAMEYDPTEWEIVVRELLTAAVKKYGEDNAYWWRDKDRASGNAKRMPGKLDYEFTRLYPNPDHVPGYYQMTMPTWKRNLLVTALLSPNGRAYGVAHTLDIECKTGSAEPNDEQWRTLLLAERNPGRHPVVVYPAHEPILKRMLGL